MLYRNSNDDKYDKDVKYWIVITVWDCDYSSVLRHFRVI